MYFSARWPKGFGCCVYRLFTNNLYKYCFENVTALSEFSAKALESAGSILKSTGRVCSGYWA